MKGNKPKGKPAGLISSRDSTRQKKAEEALRRSEERYRTILEDIKEGYWETDPAGNFTFFNDAVCHLLGYSKKKMMGMNYRAYIIAEDVDKVYKAFNQVYRTDKPIKNMLYKTIRKDGCEIFAETSVFPRRNDTGEIIGFRGVTRDVTERKEMEKALHESEERFRIAAASVSDLVWDWDIVEGKLDWFGNIDEMLGYAPGEFPRTIDAWEKAIHPDDHDRVMAVLDLHRTTRTPYFEEYRMIRKDGSIRYWIDRGAALWDEKGNAHRMFGACSDISERKQAEEALRQSEEKYRTVLEQMEEAYYEVDIAGNLTLFNDALCRALGYSREELMGVNYRVYTPPEHVKKVFGTYNQVYRTGERVKLFPMEQIRKDGTRLFSETSVFPLRNEKGEIIGFRGLSRDITERRQAEEALRQSEERYRTVLEDMEESYYEIDLAGNFTFFNDALCRRLGYSREELTGINYRVFTPPENVKKVLEAYNRVYRTGKPVKSFPVERIRKDGTRIFAESSVFSLQNERGEIIGFRGISRDVTERMQMIEALRRSGERYRTILEEMQDGYFEVDLTGNFTFFNDALCRGLGYSREELMGMNYRVYIPPEHVKKVFETYNRVYRTGDITKWFPIEQIRKDGTRVSTEDSIWPLRNERGDIIGFRGISRDVTERKQAELERKQIEQKAQLASRLASVGELASGVAHEINNPLTGVIGYAHLLLDRKDISQDIRHDLEIINEGAQRVAAIIRKLLTFARQQKPEQRFANINEIISTTLDLRTYELASNNIRVAFQPARDLPMTIVDSGQLQQVFLNLIINAETEMKLAKGGGKLSIKTEQVDNTIRISFKDNGPGIAKKNLERIFDPFFTTREVGQGTGLGLNVCHGIITAHKGKIWVESKLGRGATFIVELPIVTEDSQLVLLEPTAKEPKKVTKAKILVVDDEPVIRQFVSRVLSEEGHEVEALDNAEDALERIKSKRYSLILLDIKMPGISGIELYKQFQEIAPSLKKRVVFITGDVMGKRTTDFLAKTKAPYMIKPFDAKQLKTEIKRILARG